MKFNFCLKSVPLSDKTKTLAIENKTRVLLGLASVILVTLNILSYWSFIKQKEATERVAQSRLTLQKLEAIFSSVKDAETGQRGYLLTGQESYLKPYQIAIQSIDPQIQQLKTVIVANPEQQQQLTTLRGLIAQKLAELQQTIDLSKNQQFDAAISVVSSNRGQQLMDQIRNLIQQMQGEENEQLKSWLTTREATVRKGQLIFLLGIIMTLLALYLVSSAIQQETIERKQAEASLKQLNDELEARVQERTTELEEANTNLLRSNREL